MTELPSGWEQKRMGDIGRYLNGKAFKPQDWKTSGRPIIRIQNLTGSGDAFNYFQGEIEERYLVKPGDLLFSWSATLGTYVWQGPEAVLNQHIFRVDSFIDKKFHRYLMDFKIQEMLSKTHGSGMVHITKKSFDAIEVQIPPIPEQQKIVEILEGHLSRLDAALADVKQAKLKAAKFRSSLLQAAFTGNLNRDGTRLITEVPDGWEIKPLEDLCEPGKQAIVDGPFGSNLKRSDYVDSGIPVLKIQNVKENVITLKKMDYVKPEKYQELLRHSFAEGDIVMTKLGDPLGVSAIVSGIPNGLIVADLVRIRPSKILTKFLCYQLNSPQIQKYINEQQKGTTRPRVNLAMIRELPVYSPPLDAQRKILEILEGQLSRLDASVAIADAIEKESASLRRSLLQAAFTGQLTKEVASV